MYSASGLLWWLLLLLSLLLLMMMMMMMTMSADGACTYLFLYLNTRPSIDCNMKLTQRPQPCVAARKRLVVPSALRG